MNKKGAVEAQTIMQVLGVIIVASILVFGFRSIASFSKQGDEIQMMKFKDTVIRSIEKISTEYNSVEPVSVMGVKGILQVCFYSSGNVPSEYPLVADSIQSGAKENAFLISDIGMQDSFYVGDIELEEGFFCVDNINNRFDFTLQGLGNKVKITS